MCPQSLYLFIMLNELGFPEFFLITKEEELFCRLQSLSLFLNVTLWNKLIFVPFSENVLIPNMKSHAPMQSSSDFKMITY